MDDYQVRGLKDGLMVVPFNEMEESRRRKYGMGKIRSSVLYVSHRCSVYIQVETLVDNWIHESEIKTWDASAHRSFLSSRST